MSLQTAFGILGAWCADHAKAAAKDTNQYLQIDLGSAMTIGMIETQGEHYFPNFVAKFKLNSSVDYVNWITYSKVIMYFILLFSGEKYPGKFAIRASFS